MQQHIKKLFKDNSLFLAIGITIIIAILSLIKVGSQPIQIDNIDKIAHFLAYFVLTFFWLLALGKKVKVIIIALVCLAYGILIEVLQGIVTTYRFVEYYDILANLIGILMAVLFFYLFVRKTSLFKG